MKYQKTADGEWVEPVGPFLRIMCCDCGLTHDLEFQSVENKIQVRFFRQRRATAAARRTYTKPM